MRSQKIAITTYTKSGKDGRKSVNHLYNVKQTDITDYYVNGTWTWIFGSFNKVLAMVKNYQLKILK